jgi:3-phenylpropionate/cinnamic acid dioxygenase small subunit
MLPRPAVRYARFAARAGCASDTAACLRRLPVSTILANQEAGTGGRQRLHDLGGHFVTNVRTFLAAAGELRVQSALLLFRSRGDTREADLLSAERADLLRETADGLRLARREITVDESVLRTQNLAVFL